MIFRFTSFSKMKGRPNKAKYSKIILNYNGMIQIFDCTSVKALKLSIEKNKTEHGIDISNKEITINETRKDDQGHEKKLIPLSITNDIETDNIENNIITNNLDQDFSLESNENDFFNLNTETIGFNFDTDEYIEDYFFQITDL